MFDFKITCDNDAVTVIRASEVETATRLEAAMKAFGGSL